MRDLGRRNGRSRAVAGRPALGLLALVVTAVVLAAGCGTHDSTSEVGSFGWGTLDDSPGAAAADGAPGPQVMSEVTYPDGAVPTVPQPAVPPAEEPTTVPVVPPPAVLAAPAGSEATPAPAPAAPEVVPGGARAMERLDSDAARTLASRALGRIRFDWKTALPGWQIRFLPGRAGLRGSTFPEQQVIEVYVRSSDRVDGLAHVIAHEMGHAIDVSRLGDLQHRLWYQARGIPASVPWFPGGSGARDYATGAGDWAESFARWQTGVGWYSELGPPPDVAQTAVMAELAGLA